MLMYQVYMVFFSVRKLSNIHLHYARLNHTFQIQECLIEKGLRKNNSFRVQSLNCNHSNGMRLRHFEKMNFAIIKSLSNENELRKSVQSHFLSFF